MDNQMQQVKLPLYVLFVGNELAIIQVNDALCLPMFSRNELAINYLDRLTIDGGDYSCSEIPTPNELRDFLLTSSVPELIIIDAERICNGDAIRKRDLLMALAADMQ